MGLIVPRHDRAYGRWFQKKSGGNSRRLKKRGKNTYAPKQHIRMKEVTSVGRNDGNTQKGGPTHR